MSFVQNCKAAWHQPLGYALENFKDLSTTQKIVIGLCTVAVALPLISIPLAVVAFRSLVGRCTEQNDEQNEHQIAMVILGDKKEVFNWIKNKYEYSKSANKDSESITYEIETFEFLYNFVKNNPSFIDESNINKIIRRINSNCENLGYPSFEYICV